MSKRRVRKSFKTFFRRIQKLVSNPVFIGLTVFGNLVIVISATSLYFLERGKNENINSLLDTIWWAVSTVSTVGYGDVAPSTPPGRLVGIFTMLFGTALFWSYTALFAEALVNKDISDIEDELKSIERRLTDLQIGEKSETVKLDGLLSDVEAAIAGVRKRHDMKWPQF